MKEKIKGLLTDSAWSIAGLVLMNVVAQFLVYPVWNWRLGAARYGDILVLLAMMNVIVISMGDTCNNARMAQSSKEKTENEAFAYPLMVMSVLLVPMGLLIGHFGKITMMPGELPLYIILAVITMWRYYADVEYKLSLNYRGFFLYYLCIAGGYLVGSVLFWLTGLWPLALLPGEVAGLAIVAVKGDVLRITLRRDLRRYLPIWHIVIMLFLTAILSYLAFNADRIGLKYLIGSEAVTAYYLASLLGKTSALVVTPLNGVLIGHLSNYKGGLTPRLMHLVTLLSVGLTVAATVACLVASHILIPLLYPTEYALVKPFFLLGNMAQVIYFISTMITVALLRFCPAKYQAYASAVYAVGFCLIALLGAGLYGLSGFCWGALAASGLRMLTALVLGYWDAIHNGKEVNP